MAYSDKVVDHYSNPRNVGSLPKNDPNVGTGLVGAPECGDVMRLQMKINPETNIIEEAKFKTFGCGSAIASSSLATEWVKGKTVDEAPWRFRTQTSFCELSLPPGKNSLLGAGGRCHQGRHRGLEEQEARGRSIRRATVRGRCRHEPVRQLTKWSGVKRIMIHMTEKAASKIQELLAKRWRAGRETGGLRVGVQGGGCSGLTYAMRLETQARDRDKVVEENGARLFVDPKSFLYLHETTLDYQDDLMRRGFVFENPQASRSCGCGSSFTA